MLRRKIRKSNWGKIRMESGGCFLDPPNYPTYKYSVSSVYGDTFFMSLPAAVEADWLDDETKIKAKDLLERWNKLPLDHAEVQDWIHQVMGYFKGCFQGEDGSWDAGKLNIIKYPIAEDVVISQDSHAGVHLIRKFYPEFKLTTACLMKAYWGKKPE